MHVLHEAVEVLAAFFANRQLREKCIREKGLAASDAAPEVESANGRAAPRQQAEPAREQRSARDDAAP
jgi:hypothetical protein